MKTDVLVVGGGLSGMTAALSAQKAGASVTVLAAGMGVLYLGSGCIDLMAYPGLMDRGANDSPWDGIRDVRNSNSDHPYAKIKDKEIERSLDLFIKSCKKQNLTMVREAKRNYLIPTSIGTARPTAIVPDTMIHGDLFDKSPITILGFEGYRDFYPEMVASRIKSSFGIDVKTMIFDETNSPDHGVVNTVSLGRKFEDHKFCESVARFINRNADRDCRVGLPAVLGVFSAKIAHITLEALTERRIFEIPVLPPSLPGRRIHQALKREFLELGGQIISGCIARKSEVKDNKILALNYKAGEVFSKRIDAKSFVLATGSFFSGGLVCGRKSVREPIFGLQVRNVPETKKRFRMDFLDKRGHPISHAGIRINLNFSPCNESGSPVYKNLFAAGDILGGFDSLAERSGGGVAISSGTVAGEAAAKVAGS